MFNKLVFGCKLQRRKKIIEKAELGLKSNMNNMNTCQTHHHVGHDNTNTVIYAKKKI